MRTVAIHIGCVLSILWALYELDRPKRLEETGIDLKAVGSINSRTADYEATVSGFEAADSSTMVLTTGT